MTWSRRRTRGEAPRGSDAMSASTDRPAPDAPDVASLRRAMEAGDGDATLRLAVLSAAGVEGSADWPRALDLAVVAAERGSVEAQGQLRLLAAGPQGRSLDGEARDWRALRARVDLGAWTAAPAKEPLCERPRIRSFRSFVSRAVCDWIVARAQGRPTPALVYDAATGEGRPAGGRSNTAWEMSVADLDLVALAVRERIAAATGLSPRALEATQVLHYGPGQRFEPHFDVLDPAQPGHAAEIDRHGQRIVTFLLYLNEGYEGGATNFPRAGVSFRGRRGDGLMFANVDLAGAPEPLALHEGAPPTRGEKWLLSQWIRDRYRA